jgi:hypothetical protein
MRRNIAHLIPSLGTFHPEASEGSNGAMEGVSEIRKRFVRTPPERPVEMRLHVYNHDLTS